MKNTIRNSKKLAIIVLLSVILPAVNYLFFSNLPKAEAFAFEDSLEVCAGQSVSGGYLVTDVFFDASRCDGARIDERYVDLGKEPPGNVWLFESYKDKDIDDELEICANQSLPNGWVKVDSFFDAGKCNGSYLDDIYSRTDREPPSNVWTIRKVQ
jgi:hypothetical protein